MQAWRVNERSSDLLRRRQILLAGKEEKRRQREEVQAKLLKKVGADGTGLTGPGGAPYDTSQGARVVKHSTSLRQAQGAFLCQCILGLTKMIPCSVHSRKPARAAAAAALPPPPSPISAPSLLPPAQVSVTASSDPSRLLKGTSAHMQRVQARREQEVEAKESGFVLKISTRVAVPSWRAGL